MVDLAFLGYPVCLSDYIYFNNNIFFLFLGEHGVKGRLEKSSYLYLYIFYRISGYGWTTWS
jgi:hypothetical protein